ncbi:ATP-binding protein [Emticicia sp. SJ17W-69]|uniref:ATP-binding protein n=1 Tax=Emticicia sp. SJ17W-69 TaxID=3421657 RepID=UPI003EBBEAC9
MEVLKENLLNETYLKFIEIGLSSPESLNALDEIVSPDLMGFGTTEDERIYSISDLKELLVRQREQSQGMKMEWNIIPTFRKIMKDENSAVFVNEIHLSIIMNAETVKLLLRFSVVLEYQNDKWIVIHFHGSKPENVPTEEDTYGIEEWRKRNLELEALVKERTAELEKSLENLKATQKQLIQSEKLASLGELTAGIAHEIQNPLNFVNNFSELSGELIDEMNEEIDNGDFEEVKAISGDLKQNLEKINHHGKRASIIVKGMLEHSRSSTGVKELTDINELADEYLRLAYHGLRAKDNSFNCDFKTDFDENLPKIEVIPQDFGRVLLNLINNAFYAVQDVPHLQGVGHLGKVTVSTQKIDNQVIIKVKDNGIGMSETTKAKIFQPFFTTKPTGEGTGLGLSLAYDIITKGHGGTIEVETKEGVSTTFIIKIPYI